MSVEDQNTFDLTDVGQKLVGHSKSAEFSATRGLVIELFPFIYEASERMSARAIGRFLEQEQKIKLSQVTITRALNDPKKSWLSYFGNIESAAINLGQWFRPPSFKFLFLSKADYQSRTSFEKEGPIGSVLARGAMALLRPDRAAANKLLLQKWFSIGLGTRLKAKQYLEERLIALEDKL